MITTDPSIWLSALLIIGITLVAVRENYFSRWAEYAHLAGAVGVAFAQGLRNASDVSWIPVTQGKIEYALPLILGALFYTRYLGRKVMWLSRYGMAVLVGVGVGDTTRGIFESQIAANILATAKPITGSAFDIFHIFLGLVLAVTAAWYFISTIPQLYRGRAPRIIATIARYGMITSFGLAFSQSVMARIGSYTGAAMVLVFDWLGLGG